MVCYDKRPILSIIEQLRKYKLRQARAAISDILDKWGTDFMPIAPTLAARYAEEKRYPGNPPVYVTQMLAAYLKLDRLIEATLNDSLGIGSNALYWDVIQLLEYLTGEYIPMGHFRLLEFVTSEFKPED